MTTYFQLMDDIAHRRGLGDVLAEGTRRAAQQLTGRGCAIHVKGMEIPISTAGRWSTWTLGMLTNRGGDHLRCRSLSRTCANENETSIVRNVLL